MEARPDPPAAGSRYSSLPGTATITVMSEDGSRTQTYSVQVALRRDARWNCPGDAVTDSRAPASSR